MTDFSLWDEVGGMYYVPQAGGGLVGGGRREGHNNTILTDKKFLFHIPFKLNVSNEGGQAYITLRAEMCNRKNHLAFAENANRKLTVLLRR